MRIWKAKAINKSHHLLPGTIISIAEDGIDIATANGMLRLLQVQQAGGKVLSIADFYHARHHFLNQGQLFS